MSNWKMPEPPVGGQWMRDDYTEEMLPAGYRPLLLGEIDKPEDQYFDGRWGRLGNISDRVVLKGWNRRRTQRPLPDGWSYLFRRWKLKLLQNCQERFGDDWSYDD